MAGEVWDAPNQQVVRADESPPWEEGSGGGVAAAPVIDSVTPGTGLEAGGTSVIIAGENLADATAVKFAAVDATIDNAAEAALAVTSPAGTGTVDVTVEHPVANVTATGAFVYTATRAQEDPNLDPTQGAGAGGSDPTKPESRARKGKE
jgi:hypothetical protein